MRTDSNENDSNFPDAPQSPPLSLKPSLNSLRSINKFIKKKPKLVFAKSAGDAKEKTIKRSSNSSQS